MTGASGALRELCVRDRARRLGCKEPRPIPSAAVCLRNEHERSRGLHIIGRVKDYMSSGDARFAGARDNEESMS